MLVWSLENHTAADAWTAVGTRGAIVGIVGSSAVDEVGKDSADGRGSISVIVLWLETGVTKSRLVKSELLGKVVATFVGGVCDVDREGYVCDLEWPSYVPFHDGKVQG